LAPITRVAAAFNFKTRWPLSEVKFILKVCCMSREVAERLQGDRMLNASHGRSRVQFAYLNGSQEAALRDAPSDD